MATNTNNYYTTSTLYLNTYTTSTAAIYSNSGSWISTTDHTVSGTGSFYIYDGVNQRDNQQYDVAYGWPDEQQPVVWYTYGSINISNGWYRPGKRSHAQKMQYEINRLWNNFLEEERQAEKIIAESKAEDLMSILIGEKEFVKYKETGKAYVRGKNGLYLVKKGGGISQIKDNKIIDFCVHIDHNYNCPPTDHAIALKLMLEDDDNKVIKLANRIGTRDVDQLPIAACM